VLIRRAIVLGCALVALGAACSSGSSDGEAAPPSTTAAPKATRAPTTAKSSTTTTTRPKSLPPDALQNLILSDVPAGYKLQDEELADTGPTNLTKAALEDVGCTGSCDARRELTSAGFVDGYERQWTHIDDAGTTVDQDFIYLFEFETADGAQQYAQHWQETLLNTGQSSKLQAFTPAGIPGAVGLRVSDTNKFGGSTGVVIFAKGPYAVRAVVNGGPNVDQSGPTTSLASQQYQRLP
jgi:hypothetical protein